MRNIFLLVLLLLVGCAGTTPTKSYAPLNATDQHKFKPARELHPTGSLWSEGGNFLFADHRARKVGDIVTVRIDEVANAKKEAKTSTERESNLSAGLTGLMGLESKLPKINKNIIPTDLLGANFENDFEGSGSTERKENLTATITAEVIEILPTGNLVIKGEKIITVNFEDQIIKLEGIIRPQDVGPGNTISSENILNARISYKGDGVISDKQKQGWLIRIIDNVWPF